MDEDFKDMTSKLEKSIEKIIKILIQQMPEEIPKFNLPDMRECDITKFRN